MAAKTSVKVLINGKAVTLAGYEDEEYLQKVANYINRKIAGFEGIRGYRTMPADLRDNLLAINIADDYFKAKLQAEALEDSFEKQEHDAYETKQDLVSAQIEIEELRKVYAPPQEMLEKWNADHKKYIEKAAWIKQMLAM